MKNFSQNRETGEPQAATHTEMPRTGVDKMNPDKRWEVIVDFLNGSTSTEIITLKVLVGVAKGSIEPEAIDPRSLATVNAYLNEGAADSGVASEAGMIRHRMSRGKALIATQKRFIPDRWQMAMSDFLYDIATDEEAVRKAMTTLVQKQ